MMDVRLAAYEGPLDLLLRLITRNEIDIYDIPIAELTAQYLEEIKALPFAANEGGDGVIKPDMDGMSEFLVMAATLLEIKSQLLLPRPKPPEETETEDPREALVQKLLAYQLAQALANQLHGLTPPGERLTGAGEPHLAREADDASPVLDGIGMDDLWDMFAEIMQRQNARINPNSAGYGEMLRERFTVQEKIALIRHMLKQRQGPVRLSALLSRCRSRREMVVTFLAVLEMMRRGLLKAHQDRDFADINCEAA
jgi:segregation and condensation protein A